MRSLLTCMFLIVGTLDWCPMATAQIRTLEPQFDANLCIHVYKPPWEPRLLVPSEGVGITTPSRYPGYRDGYVLFTNVCKRDIMLYWFVAAIYKVHPSGVGDYFDGPGEHPTHHPVLNGPIFLSAGSQFHRYESNSKEFGQVLDFQVIYCADYAGEDWHSGSGISSVTTCREAFQR